MPHIDITNEMRESFDKCAEGAISAAQQMIKANPNINPTAAYKLAFAYALELYLSQVFSVASMHARAAEINKKKKGEEQAE